MRLSAHGSAEMRALSGWARAVLGGASLDVRRRKRWLGSREPVVDGPEDGLGPGRDAHLAVCTADVGLDGVDAQEQAARDLVVAHARRHQPQPLRLPSTETGLAAGVAASIPLVGCRVVLEVARDGVAD